MYLHCLREKGGDSTSKKKYAVITLALASVLLTGLFYVLGGEMATSEYQWSRTYGGTEDDYASSMVQTSDGGYALAGSTRSFGAGESDFWLVKTDSKGSLEWSRTYGGSGHDGAYCVIQTNDGGYAMVGYGFADLVKTYPDGKMEWSQTYGGDYEEDLYCVVETSDGGYALAGSARAEGWLETFLLVKVDSAGKEQWTSTGDEWSEYGACASSLVETSEGGYVLVGDGAWSPISSHAIMAKFDSAGNEMWSKEYGADVWNTAHSVVKTSDGGYAFAGSAESELSGEPALWLVKVDSSGEETWSKTYGRSGEYDYATRVSCAYSIVLTADGGYAAAGYTHVLDDFTGMDFLLVKTDSDGNMEWSRTYGGGAHDVARSLVQTRDGGYAMAGYTGAEEQWEVGGDFWLVSIRKEEIPYTLTVTSPNGGQKWIRGTTHQLTWSSSGSPVAYVKIELMKGGVLNKVIVSSTANDGSYSWTISSTQTLGTDYKIRVTSTSNSAITDSSNSNFAIVAGTLTVTIPNGGESWKRGTTHTITWSKSGSPGSYVKIELLKSGVVNRIITSSTYNDGSYNWYIPSTQTAGTDYKIRITSTAYSSIRDSSNSNFYITT